MGFAAIVHAAPLRALRNHPQQVWQLDVRPVLREQPSGPQPTVTTALGAFDLDHLVRVVGQRVIEAHQRTRGEESVERPHGLVGAAFRQ